MRWGIVLFLLASLVALVLLPTVILPTFRGLRGGDPSAAMSAQALRDWLQSAGSKILGQPVPSGNPEEQALRELYGDPSAAGPAVAAPPPPRLIVYPAPGGDAGLACRCEGTAPCVCQ